MMKTVRDLDVYNLAFKLAMEVFELTKTFPREETYSLTDQVRRSSRSVAMNIREGFAKRRYEQVFMRHLTDATGSAEETRGWLDFALSCSYIVQDIRDRLDGEYDRVGAMLHGLVKNWQTFETGN